MLDGDYGFQPAVAISDYMQRGEVAPHLIIGISNDVPFGKPLAAARPPDFTPPTRDGVMTKDVTAPYYLFLKDELLPEIAGRVRIDPAQRTLWSYSLSGSFATWLNYYDPSLFRNYVFSSPNWGQFGIQQRLIEGAVFNAPGADHRVFLSFDYGKEMTPDLDTKLRAFAAGPLPGYKMTYSATRGETHTTSWFVTLPAALRFIYGPE